MQPSLPDRPYRMTVTVRGVVQGVGFRPFVYNTARMLGLGGWVVNEADTVRIEVQGARDRIDNFLTEIRNKSPRQARIDSIETADGVPIDGEPGLFRIRPSQGGAAPRPTIPADLATCPECLSEIFTPGMRRNRYPFTNCTNCGPRWSIIERLPYDRPRTSMAGFTMCPACRGEYEDPTDRRFHAQPIACPACGPKLALLDSSGNCLAEGDEALRQSAEAIVSGQILALKGLGGFQLLVDATSEVAVRRLRERKKRHDKPLAVMIRCLEDAECRCRVSPAEAAAMTGYEAPILLLERRTDAAASDIAPSVAPGNPYLGIMLPYTPLHHLLMHQVERPIVCTSGNLSEEPMAISSEDALARLGPIADLFLVHDRPIVRPVDDSVARIGPHGLQLLRRARGFAPLPIPLAAEFPSVLAVGGHLKNTVGLTIGNQAVVSQHIGDLQSIAGVEVHRRAIDDLVDFFDARPSAVACDLHPDYASTRVAEELSRNWNVPLVRVQHHHAHVAACAAEHGLEGPVLGLSWDGTGYGPDGTVWGGEVLLCCGGEFSRLGRLRTFPLPGGDRAANEPRRSALGLLFELLGPASAEIAGEWFRPIELENLIRLLGRALHAPRTSSLGRLFDAVACLCGLGTESRFEGQAAMALEFAADPEEAEAYPLEFVTVESFVEVDWALLVQAVLEDRRRGVGVGRISGRFHNAIVEWAVRAAMQHQCPSIALVGGCFQNAVLSERIAGRLAELGFDVYTQGKVPPGDGSIALGQLLVAARWLSRQ